MKKIIMLITFLSLILLAGCAQDNPQNNQLTILASTFPLYEFAREVAPDENVQMIMPPGVDIHHYELKPSDLIKIDNADLIIYVGEGMEPWLENVLDLEGTHKNKTLKTIDEVEPIKADHAHDDEPENEHDGDEHDEFDELDGGHDESDAEGHDESDADGHDGEQYDPHIWLDFENSIKITNAIASKLSTIKPEMQEVYMQNAKNYTQQLEKLHQKYAQELSACKTRHFIVNHDSFRYLAKQYNLTQLPIRGLSAEQEPSPQTIENIIKEANKYDVQYVFFEELASPRVSDALAKEINAETLMLTPAGNIPKKDFKEKTFIDMMLQNLENLKKGLGCE